jgi:hypothetical protein
MKKMLAVLLVSMIGFMPLTTQAAAQEDYYPYYLAGGAVAGVLLFNFIMGGIDAWPFTVGSSSVAGGTLWEGPMAINRVYTMLSAVAGTLAADWGYKNLDVKKGEFRHH